ncbi:hypothetical protein [Antarctobacter sp.]|uniref:hypothetical protein n=1 Tax=Antarctobacter sp. TaxID=1872577 RepID=UPI003A91ED01
MQGVTCRRLFDRACGHSKNNGSRILDASIACRQTGRSPSATSTAARMAGRVPHSRSM